MWKSSLSDVLTQDLFPFYRDSRRSGITAGNYEDTGTVTEIAFEIANGQCM
jgi:hypothetical protein